MVVNKDHLHVVAFESYVEAEEVEVEVLEALEDEETSFEEEWVDVSTSLTEELEEEGSSFVIEEELVFEDEENAVEALKVMMEAAVEAKMKEEDMDLELVVVKEESAEE